MATGTIDFGKTFGASANAQAAPSQAQTKAQLWLNIGFNAEGAGDNGEDRFVSLPLGIPLDTQEHVKVSGSNESYREFMVARNDLLDQIMAAVADLPAGDSKLLNLQVQVRRVADERAAPVTTENRFARPIQLIG